jgi:hypothetical protein
MTRIDPSLPWGLITAIFVILTIIDLTLRGIALCRSAQAGQKAWFIVLLIINSIGILPAVYLLSHRQRTASSS